MCGITGIADLAGRAPIDRQLLERMNGALSHRGPDGDGFHVEEGLGFGHRRLSIIDLSGGAQPLYNEDDSVVVTYNGEIYNYRELAADLQKRGHTFRTHCDTEVIVHAWEEWGPRCLDRFNGMFAFAIWDRNRQTLFLARDRLGIKPLYYALVNESTLIFASEMKSLLVCDALPRRLDLAAVEDYFTFGYVPEPKSILEDVHKLEPGYYLEIQRGRPQVVPQRYWDVPLDQPATGWSAEDLVEQLESAVVRRLVADVPLGAFLSGGIDSSAVVAMMEKAGTPDILTCSIGFKEARYDESRFADMVARQKKTCHFKEIVEASDYGLLDKLVGVYDEPFADSSAIPTYRVCELARKHVTVALSGDGGDENFIGYRRYQLFSMEEKLRRLAPARLRRRVFGPLGRYYPKLDWAPRVFRGKTTFQALARDSAQAYLHDISICSDEMRSALFSQDTKRQLGGYDSFAVFDRHLKGRTFEDTLRMAQYLDFKTYLCGDILTKVDRASMAHSLEVRVPFLDYTFVERVAGYPTSAKMHGTTGKWGLKKALEPYLPAEVLYRKKMGFAVPLDSWFRDSLKGRIAETVRGSTLTESGVFDPAYLDRLVREHQSGFRDHSAPLWSLLMFEGFLRHVRPAF